VTAARNAEAEAGVRYAGFSLRLAAGFVDVLVFPDRRRAEAASGGQAV
jgi:hypothetical protein